MDALFYYSAAAYGALHGSWLVEERLEKRADRQEKNGDGENRANQTPGTVAPPSDSGGRNRSGRLLLSGNHSQAFCAGDGAVPFYGSRHDLGGGIRNQASGGQRVDEIRFFSSIQFTFILARGMNKAAAMLLPHTAAAALLVYLVIPAVCVITAWKLGAFLKKHTGPFWRLINGGR